MKEYLLITNMNNGDDDQNEESITDEEKTKESFPEVNELNEESERFDDQPEENQIEENQSEEIQTEEIQTEEKEENSEKIANKITPSFVPFAINEDTEEFIKPN